ncbi:hypothetical protein ABBQ38_007349 [Trebouxia sp. C0009 RCD-2024]
MATLEQLPAVFVALKADCKSGHCTAALHRRLRRGSAAAAVLDYTTDEQCMSKICLVNMMGGTPSTKATILVSYFLLCRSRGRHVRCRKTGREVHVYKQTGRQIAVDIMLTSMPIAWCWKQPQGASYPPGGPGWWGPGCGLAGPRQAAAGGAMGKSVAADLMYSTSLKVQSSNMFGICESVRALTPAICLALPGTSEGSPFFGLVCHASGLWPWCWPHPRRGLQQYDEVWWKGHRLEVPNMHHMRSAQLWGYHDRPCAGHLGVDMTLHNIKGHSDGKSWPCAGSYFRQRATLCWQLHMRSS